MISKKNRLSENEVKKVLAKRKPFFSHHIVANIWPNKLWYARIGIVLSGKQTRGSVNRNSYRRMIYDTTLPSLEILSYDIVFVCKKGIVLAAKDSVMQANIKKDILFLLGLIQKNSR